MATLALNCPSCGAALQVPTGVPTLACSFCGTSSVVASEGGVVFLRQDVQRVAEDVRSLKGQVDRLHQTARLTYLSAEHRRLADEIARAKPGCLTWIIVLFVASSVAGALSRTDAAPVAALVALAIIAAGIFAVGRFGPRARLQRELDAVDEERRRLAGEGEA
jgi:hypothetical protein